MGGGRKRKAIREAKRYNPAEPPPVIRVCRTCGGRGMVLGQHGWAVCPTCSKGYW